MTEEARIFPFRTGSLFAILGLACEIQTEINVGSAKMITCLACFSLSLPSVTLPEGCREPLTDSIEARGWMSNRRLEMCVQGRLWPPLYCKMYFWLRVVRKYFL